MNIWLIIMYVTGAPIVFYILYRAHLWFSKIFHTWMAKMDRIQQRGEALENKERDFAERRDAQNDLVWREKDKAIQQYQAAIDAIKTAEDIREKAQEEIEKLRTQVKDLEKQLHQARQKGIRLSEKAKKGTE
ncbi:MAG: hypothetical protein K0S08_730 [Gammaproteobacteria bacterium]|jgi:predicted  nucleic acid-binding Zn-ribbon protein|nr:hypothetical protein [Gammaproteobacteria bacterium]